MAKVARLVSVRADGHTGACPEILYPRGCVQLLRAIAATCLLWGLVQVSIAMGMPWQGGSFFFFFLKGGSFETCFRCPHKGVTICRKSEPSVVSNTHGPVTTIGSGLAAGQTTHRSVHREMRRCSCSSLSSMGGK